MTIKGYEVLKILIANKFTPNIDKVIIGLDKAVVKDYSEELIELCIKNNIVYYLANEKYKINSTYALAISWKWLIDNKECKMIVLHDSILPKYRGFAPLVNSLINREEFIGVTAFFATSEYDKGEIILQRKIQINYPIKINDAISKINLLYSEITLEIFNKIISNEPLITYSINEENATYCLWRDSEDYFINWNDPSGKIIRLIDAVGFPYMGARCRIDSEIVIIINASEVDDLVIENRDAGKVIFIENSKPIVVCGQGLLRIDEAIYETSKKSIFPLKKFRTRFK